MCERRRLAPPAEDCAVSIKPNTDDSSLHDAFRRYDENGDGEISFDEFVALLEDLGDGLSDAERRLAFDATDHDDNGSIDFQEFAAWWNDA
jgi:Ca2+-binding EF-hand superfamily protein